MGRSFKRKRGGNFDQNVGKAGVVYVLVNDGLNSGFLKIGCSTRSGHARASDLNFDANTGTPGLFRCVFECQTHNCGLAEQIVFAELHHHRRGKYGQEFFEVKIGDAKEVIVRMCGEVDLEEKKKVRALEIALAALHRAALAAPVATESQVIATPTLSDSNISSPSVDTKAASLPWGWIALVICAILFFGAGAKRKTSSVVVPGTQTLPSHSNNIAVSPPATRTSELANDTIARSVVARDQLRADPALPLQHAVPTTSPKSSNELVSAPLHPITITSADNIEIESRPMRGSLTIASITVPERTSIESVCASDKYRNGPAAYNKCLSSQLALLEQANQSSADLSTLSREERASIEAVCSTDKYRHGPVAYNSCIAKHMQLLRETSTGRPDLSPLSREDKVSIEAVCATDKYRSGPARYNNCLLVQLLAVEKSGVSRPDLSQLTRGERSSIEAVCSTDRYRNGPVAYNRCLEKHLESLK